MHQCLVDASRRAKETHWTDSALATRTVYALGAQSITMEARQSYEWRPPFAWRALAAFGYLSWAFGLGLVAPFAICLLYRNRFLTTHAVNAIVLHALGLVVMGILYALNFTLVYESEQQITSLAQFWGGVFASGWELWATMMAAETIVFLAWISRTAQIPEIRAGRRAFMRSNQIMVKALLAVLLVVTVFYNSLFWPGNSSAGLLINPDRFRDPFVLFPGHLILCCAMFFAMAALEGRLHRFLLARRVYARFLLERRAKNGARRRAALKRALLFPGWGQVYLGSVVSGIATACVFLLVLLFFTLSLLLNYSRMIESIPGLNANAAWYLLAELGLRSHIPDRAFVSLFGNWWACACLALAVLSTFLYSRWSALRLLEGNRELRLVGPHSVLLHVVPLVILLLIPVSFQLPTSRKEQPTEPLRVIPEFFEAPQQRMKLDGASTSGDESKTYGRRGTPGGQARAAGTHASPRYPGPGERSDSGRGREDRRLLLDNRRGKDPDGGRPGKRQDMTYSNYLSAKIRGAEKGFNYWHRLPARYSGVFEYKISNRGEVYDIRVVESSKHPEGDRLTVELIRAMGTVLPPPGGAQAIVQELFWNTTAADASLPTPLQRSLSHAFDGRLIQSF